MEIKILGADCASCNTLANLVKEALTEQGAERVIERVPPSIVR